VTSGEKNKNENRKEKIENRKIKVKKLTQRAQRHRDHREFPGD
jgi:hypothetical protein